MPPISRRGFLATAGSAAGVFAARGLRARELDLDAVLAPVIALEARIPESARSAGTLGTVRGGTGVVIDGAGLVLTVGYLILEAATVELLPRGLDGGRVPAEVVAWDHVTGLGLVRSTAPLGVAPMELGESSTLGKDDAVIVASWTREAGLLPALVNDRRPYAGYWEYLLEDALYVSPVHPAFPGAALIGLDGRLVGIGAFAYLDAGDEGDIADTVFIPIDTLKPILAELLLEGRSRLRRPWLGLYCEELEGRLRVRRLPADGPALGAGVRAGDRVLAVADTPVATLEELYRTLWSVARPGDTVVVDIARDGETLRIAIQSIDRYDRLSGTPGSN